MKFRLYWIPTSLLCLMMMASAIMYMVNQEFVAGEYRSLGYPVYLMYFNALCKFLGGVGILVPAVPRFLKEFAYAGYLYILILALLAHVMVADNKFGGAAVGLLLWVWSYWLYRKQLAT